MESHRETESSARRDVLKAIPLVGTWLFAGPFADLTRAWQNGLIHEMLAECLGTEVDSSDE